MDRLKKSRAVHRSAFTKVYKQLEELIEAENRNMTDIRATMELLRKKNDNLETLNFEIYECMIDGSTIELLEDETASADDYCFKFSQIVAKVSELESLVKPVADAASTTASDVKRNIRLPVLELKKFNGDLREWLPFWAQFQKIHLDLSLDESDKFQYLIQYMETGSKPRILVESFPATAANYPKVVSALQSRYGDQNLLVEVYVRELLQLILNNTNKKLGSLSSLYDKLESQLRSLESLGVTTGNCAAMLLPLVESSLPVGVLTAWQRSSYSKGEVDTVTSKTRLQDLMQFIKDEVEGEIRLNMAMTGFGISSSSSTNQERKFIKQENVRTAATFLTENKSEITCIFCSGQHKSADCWNARKMSVQERREIVQQKRSCYNCLRVGHPAARCRDRKRCNLCGRRHHILLCDNNVIKEQQPAKDKTEEIGPSSEALANLSSSPSVQLQTLLVKICGNGISRTARAIVDTASQRSYVLKDLAKEMKYQVEKTESLQHSLFGGVKTKLSTYNVFKIYLNKLDGSYACHFSALDQSNICGSIPPVRSGPWIEELRAEGIELHDKHEKPIEILIGADVAGKIFTGERRLLKSGLVAMETKLGWTLMGRVPGRFDNKTVEMSVFTLLVKEAAIRELWALDTLGIMEPSERKTKEELHQAAHQHFLKTVSVSEEGRYIVHLPWIENHPPLPSNYNVAVRRLNSVMKKLTHDGLKKQYEEVFDEWEKEGIIEQVPNTQLSNPSHYLPHRHVVKENSTTKIRPVFDASARDSKHPSLNNCVEKGLNFIEAISSILARFRIGKIGVTADIRKAFLQISLRTQDRDFLRFLWIDQTTEKMKVYRHCRVVFGLACSPFQLGAVIQFHLSNKLKQCKEGFSKYSIDVIKSLLKNFYVDNCVVSLENEIQVEQFIAQATEIMKEGQFDLRGWECTDFESKKEVVTNVLGLKWNRSCDTFSINLDGMEKINGKITKREILSVAHRVFDPIGISCCVTLLPKLLLQQTCNLKLGWDDEVPEEIRKTFLSWYKSLSYLSQIKVPRWLGTTSYNRDQCSIHVFCDASQVCFATAIFMRVEEIGNVKIQLIQAKARIAPFNKNKKEISIPRLELLAATIGARLYNNVIKDLEMEDIKVIFWSDSTTALAWINREENWDVFVSNRVKEIRELTDKQRWRHIPGELNPADLPSRGCSGKKLIEQKWWEGQSWLREPSITWPCSELNFNEEEISAEKKRGVTTLLVNNTKKQDNWYYIYFSKFNKIVRMIAWMKRFINNCKSKECRVTGILTVQELNDAEENVVKLVQQESFTAIDDKNIRNLYPFLDDDGLIRLQTAIVQAKDNSDFRYPILLPGQHEVVKRLIVGKHLELCHVGVQGLLCALRERYWIIGGRRAVRSVISKCVICKRYTSRQLKVHAPPLPLNRIRDAAAFEVTGVDLAGPVFLKEQRKAWICLFTCAVYRAVHIELVTSMSTSCFLQSLRRFIARRGRPEIIYSDNGRNFVGAENIFGQLNWDEIHFYSNAQKIKWIFNPPSAAWWGGWWERIVGLLKQLIRKVVGRTSLGYEELSTVLCDCEAVLNARPLTYDTENPKEFLPITPSMFIQGLRETGVPDCDAADSAALNRRVKHRKTISEQLRRRFRTEYLGLLIRKDRKRESPSVTIGDVVLIGSDDKKRIDWPMAIVEEVIFGRDGIPRLYRLSTNSGQILRPLQRIYPLEVNASDMTREQFATTRVTTAGKQNENLVEEIRTSSGRVVKVPERFCYI